MFIEQVYKSKRLHSSFVCRTPEEFETLIAQTAAAFEWPAVVKPAGFTPNPGHFSVETNRPTNQRSKKFYCICCISFRSERIETRIWIRPARISRSGAIEGRPKSV